jgi:hypothetical protein
MNTRNRNESRHVHALIVVICALLLTSGFTSPSWLPPIGTLTPYPTNQATPVYTVTPVPTAAPVPSATPSPAARPLVQGAAIELRAIFPAAWPWEMAHWKTLWTVVQWQDEKGHWHDVQGWRGELNVVEISGDGVVVGIKSWWLADTELGSGPFRWQVYRQQGGQQIRTSETFDLPEEPGQTTIVELLLNQIR